MAIMQDLTVTLEKIAKMQDEIIPPFCRFDSAKVLTDTVSVSTRENVPDILSATLRINCPFGFGLRHFAADQNQNVKMSGTSRRRIKIANSVPGTTWRTFFPRRCQNQNCILHF